MSVIDYKYVEAVAITDNDPPSSSDYTQVCHLQLLVHDERLEDANWVNAKLAGQLWLQPVLDFYLDHLVIKESDADADSDEGEGCRDWVDQYMLGFRILHEDLDNVSVETVLETVSIEIDEWRSVVNTLENIDEDGSTEEEDLEVILPDLLEKYLKVENDLKKRQTFSPVKQAIAGKSDGDDSDDSSSKDDEELQILLFQVVLKKETSEEESEIHEVLMDLEYLRDKSPEKLLDFLQSKLNFVIEKDDFDVKEE